MGKLLHRMDIMCPLSLSVLSLSNSFLNVCHLPTASWPGSAIAPGNTQISLEVLIVCPYFI